MIWIILAVAAPIWLAANAWRQTGMPKAVISGAYACKAHRTVYRYDAEWEHTDSAAQWNATIFHGPRRSSTSGELPAHPRNETDGLVPEAVESYIDERICAHTCGK